MRICKHGRFSSTCIEHDRKYYFFDSVGVVTETMNKEPLGIDTLSITYCYFGQGKWRSDTAYMTNIMFAKELFEYALKHKLISEIPILIYNYLNTLNMLSDKAHKTFNKPNKDPFSPWAIIHDDKLIIRNFLSSNSDQYSLPNGENAFYCEIETNGYDTYFVVSHYESSHHEPDKLHKFRIEKISKLKLVAEEASKVLSSWGLNATKPRLEQHLQTVYQYLT
jgi:hypothetical protein